jgi:hypothetical protein
MSMSGVLLSLCWAVMLLLLLMPAQQGSAAPTAAAAAAAAASVLVLSGVCLSLFLAVPPPPLLLLLLQFEYERSVAELVLGCDAAALGGPVANSGGWLKASDETHCGKMAALQV